MALKDFAEGRTDVYKIDPRKLRIKEGWNSRDFSDPANMEHVKTLAASTLARAFPIARILGHGPRATFSISCFQSSRKLSKRSFKIATMLLPNIQNES